MPNGQKHGANGNRVQPKSSVGMQHKNRYGEVLPERKPYKVQPKMQMADPNTKEWQELTGMRGPKREQLRQT